ncbi:MAG: hypothetical protein RLZZ393_19 [Pseudomonadota bacterium]|jgi:hypothetical protein
MDRIEQRRHERYRIDGPPGRRIHVVAGGLRHEIRLVNDVSVSGLSVRMGTPLAARTPVSVELDAGDLSIEIKGAVVWCRVRPAEAGAATGDYDLGIEVFSPTVLLSAFEGDLIPTGTP